MKEKGEALLETVLIAPIILMIGLFATEFGAAALRRSQLSESIRSTINRELLNVQSADSIGDGRSLEVSIEKSLRALPNLDSAQPIEVTVSLLQADDEFVRELPFLTNDMIRVKQPTPREFEVRVKVQSKRLLSTQLALPALIDFVRFRLRG